MTSTQDSSSQLHPHPDTLSFPQALQRSPRRRMRFRFLGARLLLPMMGSALLGVAGIAFLCSEVVKHQSEKEIQHVLDSKVHWVDSRLAQANTLTKAFRTSLLTLHSQDAKSPDTYRKLTLELFKSRPAAITGLGFGQSQYGILRQQQWLFSYFLFNSEVGQPLPAPDQAIRYVDGTQPGSFYPESDRYRNFFLPQIDLWTPPYQSANGLQTSFYSPIFDDSGKWLGTAFVDIDGKFLQESLAGSVLNQAGFFVLLTPEGQVVSAPPAAISSREASYRSITGLDAVWTQMAQGQSGLIEGETGYWAYARVPQNQWIMVAFVPYGAIFNQLAWIGIGGSALLAGLLLLVLVLTSRSLNRRLRPLLDECDRLDADGSVPAAAQDEIAQISAAFLGLLERLKASDAQIEQNAAELEKLEARLQQMAIVELEQKTLQAEVEQLFRMLGAVEQGDLQAAAQMGAQKTGMVADTLNRLIRRLGHIMGNMVSHAQEIGQSTQQVKQLAALITDSAQQQIQQTDRVQVAIDQMSTISHAAALQAIATSEAIDETRTAIIDAQPEIGSMTQGVNALRQGTNQLFKRAQTLSNYVELTTQFAKDQKRIAAMTRVLAANASMLASRASGQQDPEQFAVITREFETIATQVNQLAAQTNQSLVVLQQRTDQIQTVVSGLDYDIQSMIQQINQFNVGVDRSQQLFEQVQLIGEGVAQMGQQFTESYEATAAAAQTTIAAISQIAAIAATTLNQSNSTQDQAQHIEQWLQSLLHQAEFFQLQPVQPQTDSPQLVGAAAKNGTSHAGDTAS